MANDLVLCCGGEGVLEHVCGDLAEAIKANALGGDADGVRRKYINVPTFAPPGHASSLNLWPVYYPGFDPTAAGPESMKRGDYVLALRNRRCVDVRASKILAVNTSMTHRINCKKMPNWDEEITGGRGITGGSNTLQQSSGAVKDSGCGHIISFVSRARSRVWVDHRQRHVQG
ncbi:hypothetical protein BKA82DRAFT_4018190 [Pisolithus tinctorius]|nr:hypothetical protein BKA82DRAFT_4018190 [Pisolithus tinctorius]